ncbi:TPM domain-containing protein [Hymenobacter sp. BRD128]|uniref:TPM domain-containing protein n=1 Tax=Hymenobacter sp. BRD128 TaxID=2675878 RepID=UPI001564E41E|nr:TPM domain-containing protein [Hymenobacter sp. BRD128]QKG58603.1 TPM domain-containing protein [Hymenobacter sp. BRD128]
MYRFLLLALLFVGAGLGRPALAQTDSGLPARPVPFTFVTDKASLLSAGDAKKLENGLRSYAEKTGAQVVVVTVPSLGGRSVADYGRALGTAWGVGQRDKNNGVVVLVASQEHKVTIQPGSGLASVITPAVTSRIIGEMTPAFKQNNYFQGLRTGLDDLLATANPSTDMRRKTATTAAASTGAAAAATSGELTDNTGRTASAMQSQTQPSDPAGAQQSDVSAPAPSPGLGMGTLLIGALIIGGILWFVIRLFRGRSAAANNGSPNFYPSGGGAPQPNQPNQPNFYPNQGGTPGPGYGGGYPNQNTTSGGSGMGGILATGAAAAAGAYLGNRLGGSHESGSAPQHFDTGSVGNAGAGAAGTGAADDYFAGRGGAASTDNDSFSSNNDYFSDNNASGSSSGDYFSSDNSSYDDTSSGDTGGGGFDDTNDNSGSW